MALTFLLIPSISASLSRAAALSALLLSAGAGSGPAEETAARATPASASASAAKPAPPGKTAAPAKPGAARKTWTAADLAKLRGQGVSVAGSGEEPTTPDPGAIAAGTAEQAAPPVGDWAARAIAARNMIAAGEARMAAIDEISASWGAFVAATGANQAQAAHELGRLREERKAWEDAVNRARADLLHVEESARKAGVAPGAIR